MSILAELKAVDSDAVQEVVEKYTAVVLPIVDDRFDQRPTWDDWSKGTGNPFDNRPTWDNWDKRNR